MTHAGKLFNCLLEVDKTLARGDLRAARALMAEAQDGALQFQQEILATLREKEALERRLLEMMSTVAPPPRPQPRSTNVIAMPLRVSAGTAGAKPK